ncbi:MAG: hypothetical protein HQ488_04915 [Parcubacteria group bacterium]|nr:hypothetical protein [Parcubacteria group bacterium]
MDRFGESHSRRETSGQESIGETHENISDAETLGVESKNNSTLFDRFEDVVKEHLTSHGKGLLKDRFIELESMIPDTGVLNQLVDEIVGDAHPSYILSKVLELKLMVAELYKNGAEGFSWFEKVVGQFSPATALRFLEQADRIGAENVRLFIMERGGEWDEQDEFRGAILEEFFVDYKVAAELSKQKIAAMVAERLAQNRPLEMPEQDGVDVSVGVVLEMPSLEFDPAWYSLDDNKYYKFTDDHDDSDYELPSELKEYARLARSPKKGDLLQLYASLKEGAVDDSTELLESVIGLGPIPPEKLIKVRKALDLMAQVWGLQEGDSDEVEKLKGKLEGVRDNSRLPPSSESFSLHHQTLDRSRTIPSFENALQKQMMESLVASAVHHARVDDENYLQMAETLISAERQARKMYKEVVDKGVPVFKEYVRWVNTEAKEAKQQGREYPGEFYVGRDTYQTLYPAAKAMRWGGMSGGEKNRLTVFVNVSRPLLANMNKGQEAKEIMRAWLKQEGVTQEMFGIDGGYSGSGPFGVFRSLDPGFSYEQGDEQIRLLETGQDERRFNLDKDYYGVVEWMETLPKFTDRAQKIGATDMGKYYAQSKDRSPIEQMLAWTVQHAVWREMVQFDPENSLEMSGEKAASGNDTSDDTHPSSTWKDGLEVPDAVALSMEHKYGKTLFYEDIGHVMTSIEWNAATKRYELRLDSWETEEIAIELPFGVTQDQVNGLIPDIRTIVANKRVTQEAQDALRDLITTIPVLEKEFQIDLSLKAYYSDSFGYVSISQPGYHGPASIFFQDSNILLKLPQFVTSLELPGIWAGVLEILAEENQKEEGELSVHEKIVEYLSYLFPGEEIEQASSTWQDYGGHEEEDGDLDVEDMYWMDMDGELDMYEGQW